MKWRTAYRTMMFICSLRNTGCECVSSERIGSDRNEDPWPCCGRERAVLRSVEVDAMPRKTNTLSAGRLSGGRSDLVMILVATCAAAASVLVPSIVLSDQNIVGECTSEFTDEPNHWCDTTNDGCPDPYSRCALIGRPREQCPKECKYRRTMNSASGFYCVWNGNPQSKCRRCPDFFICDEYHVFKDSRCTVYCPDSKCTRAYRGAEGLCKSVPPSVDPDE